MQYQEQDQGWSRTAKVTATLAAVGAAAAGADIAFNDGELFVDSLVGSAEKAASAAQQAATEFADKIGELGAAAEERLNDALTTMANGTDINPTSYDLTNNADVVVGGPGTEIPGRISFIKDLAAEKGMDVKDLITEATTTAGVHLEGLGNMITDNPYKTAAAATAIAGGAGYVAGRSSGARACEHGHAHA